MKRPQRPWLVKTLIVMFLPPFVIWAVVSIVTREFVRAFHSIYLEFRIEIAGLREQWRKLS